MTERSTVDRAPVQLTNTALGASVTQYYPLGTTQGQDRLGGTFLTEYVRALAWADESGTLTLEDSDDRSTWATVGSSYTVSADTLKETGWVNLTKRYWRWKYVNDSTAQGAFKLFEDKTSNSSNVAITGSIPAGTNNIGDVDVASIAAGDNNIGNVDVLTIAAGDNNIGNVDIASAIPAGTNNIGDVDVLTEPATAAEAAAPPGVVKVVAGVDGTGNVRTLTTDADGHIQTDVLTLPALAAGTNIIGKVGIDQTLPGTTNGVQVNAALPAGTNNIGDVDILSIAAGDNNIGNVDVLTIAAGDNNIGNVDIASAIPAGANIIGRVGIDQTTPGTTNGVQVVAALPAGANTIGGVTLPNLEKNRNTALADPGILVFGQDTANMRALLTDSSGRPRVVLHDTSGNAIATVNTGQLVTTIKNSSGVEPSIGAIATDGMSATANGQRVAAVQHLYNGTTVDVARANIESSLLTSAERTTTGESAVQTLHNQQGVKVNIDVTAKVAATTLTIKLLMKDANGDYVVYAQSSAFAAANGTTYSCTFRPGVLTADYATGHEAKNVDVPRSYKVQAVPSDANGVTYAMSQAQLL